MAKSTKISEYKEIFDAFLKGYTDQLKDNKVLLPFNFNILDAQCGTIKENSHTNILMKLLEYNNQYGYVFLKGFIEMAGFEINLNDLKDVENLVFETEYCDVVEKTNGEYQEGKIDGLIYHREKKFAIIIENKVNKAPNRDEQLRRYIESVIGNGKKKVDLADKNNVYVVFLTKDGVEPPDPISINYMRSDMGILSEQDSDEAEDKSELISGPRYFACSYRNNILPWLENSVQPLVYQKELVLNTGLIQYIDFLKGMLGQREGQTLLREYCNNEFKTIINNYIEEYPKNNLKKQNKYLHELYNYLQKKLSNYQNKSDNDSKTIVGCINLLQNLVYEEAEKPMAEFMRITKEFFTSGDQPLIKEEDYLVNHHFTFYYIVIRDKNWPKGVYVGWSLAQFLKDEPDAVLFYQKPSDDEPNDNDDNGFIYSAKGKAWRKKYSQKKPQSRELKLPHISDGEGLKELYRKSGIIDFIDSIKKPKRLKI